MAKTSGWQGWRLIDRPPPRRKRRSARGDVEPRRRKFEMLEPESGRDKAACQCPVAQAARRLPVARGDDHLRMIAARQTGAQPPVARRAGIGFADGERERRAGVEEPDLVHVDTVPVAALAGLEQEEDATARRARALRCGGKPCLAKPAALGVRLQFEAGYDGLGAAHQSSARTVSGASRV